MVLAQLGPFAEKLPIAFFFWFSLFLSCPPAPAPAHEPTLPAHFASLAESGKNASDIPPSRPADPSPTCRLSVKLTEAETGKATAGLVRIRTAEGSALKFDELVNRGTMLSPDHGARQWHVVLGSAVLSVPGAEVTIEAISGLETELAQQSVDLRDRESAEVALPLRRFGRIADKGWRGGNTHLHLHSLTRDEADRYLRSIARADELELVFVSYLSRAKADERYISNQYARGDLRALSGHGVAFAWGEEHRHNFGVGGEGYGHVMLLDVKELIHPVSIGPGIMGAGTDAPPLRRVLEQARRDGGTTIWCHNAWGFERVSDWVAGLLDAHNIFDGGSYGNFEDGFYRLMNIGLRVPFSTGTDWFLFDFSRVYVQLDGALTTERWLEALARRVPSSSMETGRCWCAHPRPAAPNPSTRRATPWPSPTPSSGRKGKRSRRFWPCVNSKAGASPSSTSGTRSPTAPAPNGCTTARFWKRVTTASPATWGGCW
jgi:hypothetical protein